MPVEEAREIADRLTVLETLFNEKWKAHDQRATERWADLMEKFHTLNESVTKRPCVEHDALMLGLDHRVKVLERISGGVLWALGVIYVALVGIVITRLFQ